MGRVKCPHNNRSISETHDDGPAYCNEDAVYTGAFVPAVSIAPIPEETLKLLNPYAAIFKCTEGHETYHSTFRRLVIDRVALER